MSGNVINVIRELAAAIIALLVIVAVILVAIYDVVNNRAISIPNELGLPATIIIGFFFGQHAATNGAVSATTAAINHVEQSLANSNAANPKSPTQ